MNNKEDLLVAVKESILLLYPRQSDIVLVTEKPKNSSLGDLAIPLFPLAKQLKIAPGAITPLVMANLIARHPTLRINADGAYLNFFYDRTSSIDCIINRALTEQDRYGLSKNLENQKIMIEFSGPNTNKPLHLGHLRNDCLGESVSRLLKACGADVMKVNIVNDRGVHICKSMLAYQMFGEGTTPESEAIKSDHFVGKFYVKYSNWAKEHPEGELLIQELLNKWEAGDQETMDLWHLMNGWAISGMNETYVKTGISFEKVYYESQTYKLGKNIIDEGLSKNVFFRGSDGAVRLDLRELDKIGTEEEIEKNSKVFLRGDGTSVYITQDVGTAVSRHDDFPFDRLIYVVAHEQRRHFQILFYALKKLGYNWAPMMFHLSYGMVNLPDGKMKSREGTVVDADELIDELTTLAQTEINNKGRGDDVEADTAFKVALGALHYYLLQVGPVKDMMFNKADSLSFNGNTGPYIQYSAVRIASMMRKEEAKALLSLKLDATLLTMDDEWQLSRSIDDFGAMIIKSATEYAPNFMANYLYELAKSFNKYYHDVSIVTEPDQSIAASRLKLAQAVHTVLQNGMKLLTIPYLNKM